MCVIILTTPENQITREELRAAWDTNPDGAGLAYSEAGLVHFQRGFMNCSHYLDTVQELQAERPLLLHLRISTGAGVTPQGTHPYKPGNVLRMKGTTQEPLLAMNGTIRGQPLLRKRGNLLNDTASYIWKHADAFQQVNGALLDIVSEATGAKWAAATPAGLVHSGNFQEYEGRLYSNLNHLWLADYYSEPKKPAAERLLNWWEEEPPEAEAAPQYGLRLRDLLDADLYEAASRDWLLFDELSEYVWQHCSRPDCHRCSWCLSQADSLGDLRDFLSCHEEDVLTLAALETLSGGGEF